MSPFFRLLRFCEEKQNQEDLEEIDALLGEKMIAIHSEANLFFVGFLLKTKTCVCIFYSRLPSHLNRHGCCRKNRQPVQSGEGVHLHSVISYHQLVQRGNCTWQSDPGILRCTFDFRLRMNWNLFIPANFGQEVGYAPNWSPIGGHT